MRRLLLSALLACLCVPLVLAAALTLTALYAPARALSGIAWGIDHFTGLELVWEKPSLDARKGHFSARELHLLVSSDRDVPLLSIVGLDLSLVPAQALRGQLSRARIKAQSVVIYTSDQDEAEDPAPATWLNYLRWLPASLAIDSVHLIARGENLWIFPLKSVRGERLEPGNFRLKAAADYEGEALDVTLYLYALRSQEGLRGIQMRGEFHATQSSRLAIVEGEFRGGIEAFSYDFSLNAAFPRIEAVLAGFDRAPPISGALQVRGHVAGDLQGFTLDKAEFRLLNSPAYEFAAQGELRHRSGGPTELQVDASGELESLDAALGWLALDLSSLGRTRAKLSISGNIGELSVDELALHTRHPDGLEIAVTGSLGPGALSGEAPPGSNAVKLALSGPSLQVLSDWLGEIPLDPGPWSLDARLDGDPSSLRASQLNLRMGEADGARLVASGSLERIRLDAPFSAASLEELDLQVSAFLPELTLLDPWFSETMLPAGHSLKVEARVAGSGTALRVDAGSLQVSSGDLNLQGSALTARVLVDTHNRPRLDSLEIVLQGSLSDTSALSQYIESPVPVMGAVNFSTTLTGTQNRYALQRLKLAIDSDQLRLNAQGAINELNKLDDGELTFSFSGLDAANLVHTLLPDFRYQQPLGSLQGTATLQVMDTQWSLRELRVENAGQGGFELKLNGELEHLGRFPQGGLQLAVNIDNTGLLTALTGLPLPPLALTLDGTSQADTAQLQGELELGRSRLLAELSLRHRDGAIGGLDLSLRSPGLWLQDAGLGSEQKQPEEEKTNTLEALIENTLEALIEKLPDYPLSLRVNLDELRGDNSLLRNVAVHLSGENRYYLLRELDADYAGGRAEFRGLIDLQAQPPGITAGGQALALDMTNLAKDLQLDTDIEGVLNLRGGLAARGSTSQEWLQSMAGSLALALEDAQIQGAAYDVLATDFLAWIYSGAALEDSTSISCAMARFDIREGIARTDNLFVESPRMIARGKGELDLARQRLEMTVTPVSRNRLIQIPSSIRLKGDMASPKVSVSPIAATANASTELLMLIPTLTMKLFGIQLQQEQQPCRATLEQTQQK